MKPSDRPPRQNVTQRNSQILERHHRHAIGERHPFNEEEFSMSNRQPPVLVVVQQVFAAPPALPPPQGPPPTKRWLVRLLVAGAFTLAAALIAGICTVAAALAPHIAKTLGF
jgi:hypothetical protein